MTQRRLARAVGPHDGVDLTERDFEVHPGEYLALVDRGGQLLNGEGWGSHASTSTGWSERRTTPSSTLT